MLEKKGIGPFIAFVLVVIISVAGIVLALRIGSPLIEKTEEYTIAETAKSNMMRMNSVIKEISYEGNGSSRSLDIKNRKGSYEFSSSEDELIYVFETKEDLFSDGLSKREGDLYIIFENNTLLYKLNHTEVDITNDGRWASGNYRIVFRNNGFSGGKTKISISVL